MKIGFRVDSSNTIGTGHVHRCLTLAQNFKNKGIGILFLCKNERGNINKKIYQHGFDILNIPLKKNNNQDAEKTIFYITKYKIDFILIDNSSINLKWEKKVSKHCKIILLDDNLKRKSICDYYINYHKLKNQSNEFLFLLNNDCIKFFGPRYSIVKKNTKKKIFTKKNKIFVFMGGVDNYDFTSKIILILKNEEFKKYKIEIMIGQKNLNKKNVISSTKNFKNFTIKLSNYKNLFSFFRGSSLVITNAGVTMYEHLSLGVKSLVIPQSSLHRKILKNYKGTKLINYINSIDDLKKIYILNLIRKKMDNKIISLRKRLFDGRGALRLANYFSNFK